MYELDTTSLEAPAELARSGAGEEGDDRNAFQPKAETAPTGDTFPIGTESVSVVTVVPQDSIKGCVIVSPIAT